MTTHPCGRDDLHTTFDSARTSVEALADEIAAAHRPAEKAGRALSTAEAGRVERTRTAFDEATGQLRKARRDLEDHHLARKCASSPPTAPAGGGKSARSEMDNYLDDVMNRRMPDASGQRGGLKGRDTRWSVKALESMRDPRGFDAPTKSLAVPGSVLVPTAFDGVPVADGQRPTSIRELLPTLTLAGTDRYGFLRQVARTNRAAPVAPGRVKPTSAYTLARVEDRCRTVAHLSEPMARQDLVDSGDLALFLDSEMRYGLLWAVEDQIVNGTGTYPTGEDGEPDENGEQDLLGILATPDTVVQPWAGDLFTTTRRALTIQQQLGNAPTAWAINPTDWERFELAREESPTTGGFVLATGPVDRAAQRLWSLPVVPADVVPAGTAILGDWAGSARVYQRESAQVEWSDAMYFAATGTIPASSAFARNQLVMRAEERVGFAITRPSAFAAVALTEPA